MKMSLSLLAFAMPLLIATPASAVINLIQNGDFATGTFANWTTSGSTAVVSNVASIGLAPTRPAGSISQATLPMLISSYAVDFSFQAFEVNTGAIFTATLGGSPLFTYSGGDTGPTNYSFSFQNITAGATPLLAFSSTGGDNFRVDNVVVRQVPGPLPLLGVIGAFAWSRQLRKRIKESKAQV